MAEARKGLTLTIPRPTIPSKALRAFGGGLVIIALVAAAVLLTREATSGSSVPAKIVQVKETISCGPYTGQMGVVGRPTSVVSGGSIFTVQFQDGFVLPLLAPTPLRMGVVNFFVVDAGKPTRVSVVTDPAFNPCSPAAAPNPAPPAPAGR